jgi:integrase
MGFDPVQKKRAERAERKAAREAAKPKEKMQTFREVAVEYMKMEEKGWTPKHSTQWGATLETHVHPVIGDLPVNDIAREHVLKILLPIWLAKRETARRVRSRIETVQRYAEHPNNPARDVLLGALPDLCPGHELVPRRKLPKKTA